MVKSLNRIQGIIFYNPPKTNLYRMFDIKKSIYVGEMSVAKRKDLYIESLNVEPNIRRNGYGKRFLNFAVNLSNKLGLNGNLRVMAGLTANDLLNPPHIFYRKYGFTSDNKEVLSKIDKFIENQIKPEPYDLPITVMYYVNNKK